MSTVNIDAFRTLGRSLAEQFHLDLMTMGDMSISASHDRLVLEVGVLANALGLPGVDRPVALAAAIEAFDARFRELPSGAATGGGSRLPN